MLLETFGEMERTGVAPERPAAEPAPGPAKAASK
jgi:hypothetical protein